MYLLVHCFMGTEQHLKAAQVGSLGEELASIQQDTRAAVKEKTLASACVKICQDNVEKLEQCVLPHVAVFVWEILGHHLEAVEKGIPLYRDLEDWDDTSSDSNLDNAVSESSLPEVLLI